jgi:hypothetical protein
VIVLDMMTLVEVEQPPDLLAPRRPPFEPPTITPIGNLFDNLSFVCLHEEEGHA